MIYKKYSEYLKQQIVRAESKWGRKPQFNDPFKLNLKETIKRAGLKDLQSVCCMGVRDGTELFVFKELFPEAEVCGVDITENIKTIKTENKVKVYLYDFNNLPVGWGDKYDLIYSNSLDHSYKPEATILEWHRVSKNGGHVLVELSTHPETNIEHQFSVKQLPLLFPDKLFNKGLVWVIPERKIITGLFKVIK